MQNNLSIFLVSANVHFSRGVDGRSKIQSLWSQSRLHRARVCTAAAMRRIHHTALRFQDLISSTTGWTVTSYHTTLHSSGREYMPHMARQVEFWDFFWSTLNFWTRVRAPEPPFIFFLGGNLVIFAFFSPILFCRNWVLYGNEERSIEKTFWWFFKKARRVHTIQEKEMT